MFDAMIRSVVIAALLAVGLIAPLSAEDRTAPSMPKFGLMYSLEQFGPVDNATQAEQTFEAALKVIETIGGGTLYIPAKVSTSARLHNSNRWSHSINPTSNDLRDWRVGPGVFVIDARDGNMVLRVPQHGDPGRTRAGLVIQRDMRLPPGDSLQHWTVDAALAIENNVVHGPVNYMEWIPEGVKAGPNARFYVPTARNLFRGMYLNAHQGPGYAGKVQRITVKDIGWDDEKQMHYFTAHTNIDHKKGAIMQNKSHASAMHVVSNMNAANQTFDIYAERNQYANGDSYIFNATFRYMGNVHSMPGDENGACYVAYIRSDANVFRGTVKAIDPVKSELVFYKAHHAHTLANSRPIINLNPDKWITQGTVLVVPPCDPTRPNETIDNGHWKYKGKTYPSRIEKNPRTNVRELIVGGLIRGTAEAPWDRSLIGSFFAIDEPSEYVSSDGRSWSRWKNLRRWYEIADVIVNDDGTKDLKIKRYWWGAKGWSSITLYDPQNYTRDGAEKPLKYVIAPGAYVNDISRAVGDPKDRAGVSPHTLGLTRYPQQGMEKDFSPDDPIEQAIGADPFKPQGHRVWTFDAVPGAWPSAMVDLANFGPVARSSALTIHGGPVTLEQAENRRERRPAWDTFIKMQSAATIGLEFGADFADAALLFRQPNHEQAIKWHYDHAEGRTPREAVLSVSKESGNLQFNGAIQPSGISGDDKPARNLRGKNVVVAAGARKIDVQFAQPEVDGEYAVFIEKNWFTDRIVKNKTDRGFTVEFKEAAPNGATIDWMIVR